MVESRTKKLLWALWLLFIPAGMVVTYILFPPQYSLMSLDALCFLLLTLLVSVTPIIINNTPIFLIQWVSLVVFLVFGLFAEMIFMQIAIVALFISIRLPRDQHFRYALNWFMFFFISLLSGLVYYGLGGSHGTELSENPNSLLIVLAYATTYFLLNHLFIKIYGRIVYKERRKIIDKDFIWEAFTTLLTFPLGLILYILYEQMGLMSIVVVGIPFVSLSVILKLYYITDKINENLQRAAEIGHQLAEKMQVNEVLDLYVQKLTELVPVDYAYVLEVIDNKELRLRKKIERDTDGSNKIKPLHKNEGISGYVWAQRKGVLFHSKKEWKHIVKGYMPDSVESIISVPIIRNNEVVGVVLLASKRKRAYEKAQLMIIDILSSYFAVAIENARYYEKTIAESERCPLTNLYNFRYLEKFMGRENKALAGQERKHLSAIMLDIDHFKNVNDTYGHESGNEILCELASRLVNLIGDTGTVFRFGGEEFVILLPDVEKSAALNIAEFVRQTIAHRPFILQKHIQDHVEQISVQITASIGVSTAPEDADDVMALIRHADRALYVGAKRNGRNKVAQYLR